MLYRFFLPAAALLTAVLLRGCKAEKESKKVHAIDVLKRVFMLLELEHEQNKGLARREEGQGAEAGANLMRSRAEEEPSDGGEREARAAAAEAAKRKARVEQQQQQQQKRAQRLQQATRRELAVDKRGCAAIWNVFFNC